MTDEPAPTLRLVEETASEGRRSEVTGTVRVRTETDAVEEVLEDVRERDSVEATRVPVNRVIAATPREARMVEEIALRRAGETHVETVADTERRTEVEIEDDRDAAAARDRSTV